MQAEAFKLFCDHAQRENPRECCGWLVETPSGQTYVESRNNAPNPEKDFETDPRDYLLAVKIGKITAICHSHPNASPKPSQADRAACEASNLPWYIVSAPAFKLRRLDPRGFKSPLLERPFVHGVHDCYSLIRDYYDQVLSIELPDFPRDHEWWNKGEDLYVQNFAKAGFVEATNLKKHDVVLMMVRAKVTNHAGVYLGDEDGRIMHHLFGQLSKRDLYAGFWHDRKTHILRHTSLM
jgi:proteasome lid subunit RPN8/RPN11